TDALRLRYLRRPLVFRHVGGVLRVARDLAADVPELLEVGILRALRRLHAERRVAARAAAAGHVVPLLRFFRQREQRLEGGVGLVDPFLRDAVVADAGEAPFAVGGAQLVDEGLAVRVRGRMGEAADVEGGDSGGHVRFRLCSSFPRKRESGFLLFAILDQKRDSRFRGNDELQTAAARTASARVAKVDSTSAASSASTVTRTTGSVPDGRRNARP